MDLFGKFLYKLNKNTDLIVSYVNTKIIYNFIKIDTLFLFSSESNAN